MARSAATLAIADKASFCFVDMAEAAAVVVSGIEYSGIGKATVLMIETGRNQAV